MTWTWDPMCPCDFESEAVGDLMECTFWKGVAKLSCSGDDSGGGPGSEAPVLTSLGSATYGEH